MLHQVGDGGDFGTSGIGNQLKYGSDHAGKTRLPWRESRGWTRCSNIKAVLMMTKLSRSAEDCVFFAPPNTFGEPTIESDRRTAVDEELALRLTPMSQAAATRNARRVVQVRSTYPGLAQFEVYTCENRLIATPTFAADVVDDELLEGLHAFLERHCPSDVTRHGPTCPSSSCRDAGSSGPALRLLHDRP